MSNVLPAGVTISDLPTGTTLTGAELLEAVQTVGGVGNSIQIPISQIATTALGTLPVAGATGQFLQKSGGTNFAATWANVASNVLASTGLSQAGSTTVSLALASVAGLSVLGVGATASAVPSPIVGAAGQILRVNDAGNALIASNGLLNWIRRTRTNTTGITITNATTGSGGSQNMPPTIVSFLALIKT